MKPAGEPDAGNPHVRFDERGRETGCCRMAQVTAPFLDSTPYKLTPLSDDASCVILGLSLRHREARMDTLSQAACTRRSLLRSTAGAAPPAALPPALRPGSAPASTYRGIVGDIKPRATDSSLVDMIRLLPEGIGVIPVYLNLTQGSRDEYGSSYAA